jgi:hypothetical protein
MYLEPLDEFFWIVESVLPKSKTLVGNVDKFVLHGVSPRKVAESKCARVVFGDSKEVRNRSWLSLFSLTQQDLNFRGASVSKVSKVE